MTEQRPDEELADRGRPKLDDAADEVEGHLRPKLDDEASDEDDVGGHMRPK